MEPLSVDYSIRDFSGTDADVDHVCNLWQSVFPDWPVEQARLAKILRFFPGQHAIHDHGFCLAYLADDGRSRIAAVGVLAEHRSKGLGTALLSRAQDRLKSTLQDEGKELVSLEVGSIIPRYWPQLSLDFPPEVTRFFTNRGYKKSNGGTVRDLYKDIRGDVAPPDILERVSKSNLRFSAWSPELYDECITKQKELFTWAGAYEALAAYNMYDQVLVAFDPDTNKQVGWTIMCAPSAAFCDAFAFLPLLPSGEETGVIGAVGVDESVRGRGVGLALVVKAMEHMQQRGVKGVMIDMVAIQGFYEKLGCETFWEYEAYKWQNQ